MGRVLVSVGDSGGCRTFVLALVIGGGNGGRRISGGGEHKHGYDNDG